MEIIQKMCVVRSAENNLYIGYLYGMDDIGLSMIKHVLKVECEQSITDIAENGVRNGNVTVVGDVAWILIKEYCPCKI